MLAVLGTAIGIAVLTHGGGDLTVEAMLLVTAIVVVSLQCRRAVAWLGVAIAAIAFNFFFTEPRFTLAIAEPSYVAAFVVMLLVGGVITTLVNAAREAARVATQRGRELTSLYALATDLADADRPATVAAMLVQHLRPALPGELQVFAWPDAAGGPPVPLAASGAPPSPDDLEVVDRCRREAQVLTSDDRLCVPLLHRRGVTGALLLRSPRVPAAVAPLLRAAADQAAAALERLAAREMQRRDREAAAQERLRSTLLASVSHDLRTPLTSILGAASSLLEDGEHLGPAARQELLAGIRDEASRLNDLIANLLFATRLDVEAVRLRCDWTSLGEVVAAALRRARLADRGVAVQLDPTAPLLRADPVLLEQAVFQLLDNAGKHTPAGTPVELRVALTGDRAEVVVADRGPGVPAAVRERLFDRFHRGPSSQGLGLGLAIAAAIAKAHGGGLELVPAAAGATFVLWLPCPSHQPSMPSETEVEP